MHDVIKRDYEIKEKEWKKESHSFGLRKVRRKFPHFLSHTYNAPKRRRKMRKIKGKERKAKRKEAKRDGEEWRMQWLGDD